MLIAKLSQGRPHSIAQLTAGSRLTRQAITKHLRVLEGAGLVHSVRDGRESLYEYDPEPIEELRSYLDRVSARWDEALGKSLAHGTASAVQNVLMLLNFFLVVDQKEGRGHRSELPRTEVAIVGGGASNQLQLDVWLKLRDWPVQGAVGARAEG